MRVAAGVAPSISGMRMSETTTARSLCCWMISIDRLRPAGSSQHLEVIAQMTLQSLQHPRLIINAQHFVWDSLIDCSLADRRPLIRCRRRRLDELGLLLAIRGRVMVNVVPSPTVLTTPSSPPWSLTIVRAMASPCPEPLPIAFVVKKRIEKCAAIPLVGCHSRYRQSRLGLHPIALTLRMVMSPSAHRTPRLNGMSCVDDEIQEDLIDLSTAAIDRR